MCFWKGGGTGASRHKDDGRTVGIVDAGDRQEGTDDTNLAVVEDGRFGTVGSLSRVEVVEEGVRATQ